MRAADSNVLQQAMQVHASHEQHMLLGETFSLGMQRDGQASTTVNGHANHDAHIVLTTVGFIDALAIDYCAVSAAIKPAIRPAGGRKAEVGGGETGYRKQEKPWAFQKIRGVHIARNSGAAKSEKVYTQTRCHLTRIFIIRIAPAMPRAIDDCGSALYRGLSGPG